MRMIHFALVALCMAAPARTQVPPPPLLPEQGKIAEQLVRVIEGKDAPGYAALLANDLQVFEDVKLVAISRDAWLKIFLPTLEADGVKFKIDTVLGATGRLTTIEYFNSVASWNRGAIGECCWSTDVVSYQIDSSDKITRIIRIRGGKPLDVQKLRRSAR